MVNFFKGTAKQPLPYAVIEERKQTANYTLWLLGGIIIIVLFLIYILFR